MNSEKVKEIKNWLENESEVYRNEIAYNTLDLINELESENERLNECYKVKAYDKLRAENKQLKDRIAELEKGNEALSFAVKQGFNDCQTKTLKQFAERLIEKKVRLGDRFNIYDIDETLKEFI